MYGRTIVASFESLKNGTVDQMVHKLIGIASLLIACSAGCSKSPTALMERQAEVLEEAAQILKEIADIRPNENDVSESPALQAKFRRLGQLQGMIDKLVRQTVAAQVPDEIRDELEDSYLERMANAAAEFHRQLARVRELNLKSGGLSDLEAVLFDES